MQSGRISVALAAVASLALVAATAVLAMRSGVTAATPPQALLPWATAALAGLALVWALAAATRPRTFPPAPPLDPAALLDAESRLAAATTRIGAVREVLAADLDAITAGTAALANGSGNVHERAATAAAALHGSAEAADALAARVAHAGETAAALALALDTAAERADARVAALTAATEAADAAAARAAERAAAALAAADAATAALTAQATRLAAAGEAAGQAGDAALARLDAAESARVANLSAHIDRVRSALDAAGGDAARAITRRLEGLGQAAHGFEARIAAAHSASEALTATGERGLKLLDARLDHAARATTTTLESLQNRLAATGAAIDGLAAPVRTLTADAAGLDSGVGRLRESVLATIDSLAEVLPARTVSAGQAADTMTAELTALVQALELAHARAEQLAAPITDGRETLLAAARDFAAQRESVATAGEALVVELNQARALIAEVEQATADTSLAAATRLVDAMSRVREVATQAAGTMRHTLDGVIEESRAALTAVAERATRDAFIQPVTAQAEQAHQAAAGAADTARRAAERTAAALANLAQTTALLDSRIAASDAALHAATHADLAAAAAALTERMSAASIDLSAAMGRPMADADWAAWSRGERGLFARRAVKLLGGADRQRLERLMADPAFAAPARRLAADFTALLDRLGPGPHRPALEAALRDTAPGRLASILEEVAA